MFGRRRDRTDSPDQQAGSAEQKGGSAEQKGGSAEQTGEARIELPLAEPDALRSDGPWDHSEHVADDEYLDLGSLKVRGRDGMSLQLPTDNGQVIAVVVLTEESAMELRVFAASRSGGEWTRVSAEIADDIERLGGTWSAGDGPFGSELHGEVTVTDEDGNEGLQISRMVGVEGPRWLLRATLFGAAAQDGAAAEPLLEILRDVVVHRGKEARMVGEPLPLTMPAGVVEEPAEPGDLD